MSSNNFFNFNKVQKEKSLVLEIRYTRYSIFILLSASLFIAIFLGFVVGSYEISQNMDTTSSIPFLSTLSSFIKLDWTTFFVFFIGSSLSLILYIFMTTSGYRITIFETDEHQTLIKILNHIIFITHQTEIIIEYLSFNSVKEWFRVSISTDDNKYIKFPYVKGAGNLNFERIKALSDTLSLPIQYKTIKPEYKGYYKKLNSLNVSSTSIDDKVCYDFDLIPWATKFKMILPGTIVTLILCSIFYFLYSISIGKNVSSVAFLSSFFGFYFVVLESIVLLFTIVYVFYASLRNKNLVTKNTLYVSKKENVLEFRGNRIDKSQINKVVAEKLLDETYAIMIYMTEKNERKLYTIPFVFSSSSDAEGIINKLF